MRGNNARLLLMLLAGALAGSILNQALIGQLPASLTNSLTIGLDPPVQVDLFVFRITLGFALHLSLLSILGMAGGVYVYRRWV